METHKAAELAILIFNFTLFIVYHLWFFYGAVKIFKGRRRSNMFYINRQAREAWAREACKGLDAPAQTYIAQTLRNSITASSLLATACSLIAISGVGNVLVDGNKLNTLARLEESDPILNGRPGLIAPALKLGIIEAMVLFTFVFFTQSVRLSVNMSFYARNIHAEDPDDFYNEDEFAAMSKRAAVCFTLGARTFYAIVPLIFWLGGPTWFLSVTVALTGCLFLTDYVPASPRRKAKIDEEKALEEKSDTENASQKGGEKLSDKAKMIQGQD